MLRFKNLASGSTGNATLVEASALSGFASRLLVDCGLGIRSLATRLGEAGLELSDVHAVFITHEHSDHIGCAIKLALRHRIPVWMSRGTYQGIGEPDMDGLLNFARDGRPIAMGDLQVTPFTVPHDAREPLQLSCTDGAAKLGIVTDLGHATSHVVSHLMACHALMLECNHDIEMLQRSAYPAFLKRRIAGDHGHLSNAVAADIARAVKHGGLKHLVAAHLSEQNNRPCVAQESMAEALGCQPGDIVVASPTAGTPWLHA